jgi:hypothetical protein
MLTSLVADAVARNPAGPPPAIIAEGRGGQVELRITDHGPGGDDGGASLAFRLARDLADAMGDTLRCEQVPGNGRTVTITLPAAAARSCPAPGDLDLTAQSSLSDSERTVVPAPLNDLGPRVLGRHGYRVIAAPESFLVGPDTRLLDGEEARAARWGAALASSPPTPTPPRTAEPERNNGRLSLQDGTIGPAWRGNGAVIWKTAGGTRSEDAG